MLPSTPHMLLVCFVCVLVFVLSLLEIAVEFCVFDGFGERCWWGWEQCCRLEGAPAVGLLGEGLLRVGLCSPVGFIGSWWGGFAGFLPPVRGGSGFGGSLP